MAFLTVFTPTYNRVELLKYGYDALKRQTCKDFIWLIVDDGSTDNTRDVVQLWQNTESEFEIKYIYKENGGLHTGYNAAIEVLNTELAVCIDSDDYLTDNAVEKIKNYWHQFGNDKYAGIVSLDADKNGNVIGDLLPDLKQINLIYLLLGKYRIKNGDRKLFIRSDLYKSVAPQPSFPGEKNFNPHYMHLQISENYDFLVMNEVTCIVEYQPTGMTNNIFRQYKNSPNSFAQTRRLYLSFKNASMLFRFKQCIHYVSSSILARDKDFIKTSPAKLLTLLAIPFGFVLAGITVYKAKR